MVLFPCSIVFAIDLKEVTKSLASDRAAGDFFRVAVVLDGHKTLVGNYGEQTRTKGPKPVRKMYLCGTMMSRAHSCWKEAL